MILSALVDLYARLADDPERDMPRLGWSRRQVSFALILRPDGTVAELRDLRERQGKRMATRDFVVPDHGEPRTSGAKDQPYFLCDATAFLLGADAVKGEKAAEYFASSRRLHDRLLAGCDDPMAAAIRAFFATWTPAEAPALAEAWSFNWAKDVSGKNVVFGLDGHPGWAHQRPGLTSLWGAEFGRRAAAPMGQCLVTGEMAPIARTHAGLKLPGTTGNGAMVVSFNRDSFASYGHDQGLNAPVGEAAAFAYTAALTELLRRKLSFGDTTVVLWAERDCDCDAEDDWSALFEDVAGAEDGTREDAATAGRVRAALLALRDGRTPRDALGDLDLATRFYVLGIAAPGGSRVSVRFWLVTTLGELLEKVGGHVRALAIERRHPNDPKIPGIRRLLRATALMGKDDNVSPTLAAAFLRAVLTGAPYPSALLAATLQRMRTEHGDTDPVSTTRMALVKACLARGDATLEKTLMTLNTEDTDTAYRLGRLFAALERAQQLALGRAVNATIKDRYFGAASATPKAVFPNLIRLAQHHLSKADNSGWLDRLIGDIAEGLEDFPAHLPLDGQGRFALGYYHQRNDLWRKKD